MAQRRTKVRVLGLSSREMSPDSGEPWIRRLLDVARALTTELDQRVLLDRVLETAREITGARYAALGILNEEHSGLEQFLTADPRCPGVRGEV